jgi:RNA polymerase sigma-70 factor (ECF subfamily)
MDMVQNSFVKAIEQIHTLRNPDAMKTWFYRILTNECLQALKKTQREHLVEPADIQDEIYLEKAYEPALELYEAIRQLPPETQTIIYLHYYEEYTLKEISNKYCKPYLKYGRLKVFLYKLHRILGLDKE